MTPSRDTDGTDPFAPFYAALERYFEAEDQVLADMQARIDRLREAGLLPVRESADA